MGAAGLFDFILVAALAELCLLYIWLPRSGSGLRFGDVLPNFAAGFVLLVAVRLAIADVAWHWLALLLTLALVAHVLDLRQRLRYRRL